MWYVIGGLVGLVLLYLFINNSRNSDPLNRKCAAAVCEYVTTQEQPEPGEIAKIFEEYSLYQKQAMHIVSMVPALLIKSGYPKDAAMSVVPVVRAAALMQTQ